uniref:Sphingosine-1-phosphate phosphohydrolase n=1 Tax=Rhizophora mucronata TaxID=61149 RepID=A0A2P2J323_RHIMU
MAVSSPPPPPRSTLVRHLRTADTKLSYYLHSLFNPYLPIFLLLLLEYSADFRLFFPVSAALLLSPQLLPFASPLILGLLLDLALVGLIKSIFRRSRPVYNHNMSPVVSVDHFSFPSGHASRIFFVATVVSLSSQAIGAALAKMKAGSGGGFVDQWFGGDERNVVGIVVAVVYVWAATTATSRVVLGRHYVFDVLAGAFVGVLEGLFAFRFLRFEDFFR